MVSLDALIPEEFSLDKHCPWTEEAGVKSLKLPTAVTRTFWMSPAIHRLRQFRRVLTVDVVLEMILLSSYQISWSQYWVVTKRMLSLEFDLDYLSRPSYLFCKIATIQFESFPAFRPPALTSANFFWTSIWHQLGRGDRYHEGCYNLHGCLDIE